MVFIRAFSLSLVALSFSVNAADPVPVIDLGGPRANTPAPAANVSNPTPNYSAPVQSANKADLLYQLEILQQEVQTLRGLVEQQAYEMQQMREEQKDRYLDLDRRIGLLSQNAPAASPSQSAAGNQEAASGDKAAYEQALQLIRGKQYEASIQAFNEYLQQYPNGEYRGNSFYWVGEVQYLLGNMDEALKAFGALMNADPNHRKVPDARLKLGKVYVKLGDVDKARKEWQTLVDQFSGTAAARIAASELDKLTQ